ncbi:hypothetical protein L798_14900 [Zootermopsis nevadensis]|uniref:Uncharacterized protein n=1 Tax=Zootermopsis nevadensis TaxID=136037 RepID=A0A067QMU5_ZOONE|nr:hypothetical protein L798_14900 [Zootermopsis nevadensis]
MLLMKQCKSRVISETLSSSERLTVALSIHHFARLKIKPVSKDERCQGHTQGICVQCDRSLIRNKQMTPRIKISNSTEQHYDWSVSISLSHNEHIS